MASYKECKAPLKTHMVLGEKTAVVFPAFSTSKVCSLASKGDGESVCLDERDVSRSLIPYLEMLTPPMRFPWCT